MLEHSTVFFYFGVHVCARTCVFRGGENIHPLKWFDS